MSEEEILALVKEGEALLDEKHPGWRENVDIDRLNIQSPCHCVLGQIYGHYETGKNILGLSEEEAMIRGFQISYSASGGDLNRTWKNQLAPAGV
ncbi:hypothetical protein N9L18_00060 [Candidatus Pacebacteria bacterium]|nr:hypothetical protein [Candidatus Paceibacterota bacterium]